MAYTTNQLISGAYYASGVVSREFETVSGSQLADGLQWVNEILQDKDVDQGMVPYETTYYLNAKIDVEKYFIPDLIQIDTLVFYLQTVRYSMVYTKRNQYFGAPRVENIQSLPFEWYWERQTGGGTLYLYFKPDKQYPLEIHGTFRLCNLELGQDLSKNTTTANLGVPTIFGAGFPFNVRSFSFTANQFVVNGYDLQGFYPNIGSLINFINTGIISNVSAFLDVLNNFTLFSDTNSPVVITVETNGYPPNGTRFRGEVKANSIVDLGATYINGNQGQGATLTSPVPAVLIINGYVVLLGDRVLINAQTSPAQNGIYILTTLGTGLVPWELTRDPNYDISVDIEVGDYVSLILSSVVSGITFIQTDTVDSVGTSPISFSNFTTATFPNFSTINLNFKQVFVPCGYDQFYITYLRYALADRICSEYNYQVPMGVAKQLAEYEGWINKKSRLIDLRMQKVSTLQKQTGINWAQINIGKGFSVPS